MKKVIKFSAIIIIVFFVSLKAFAHCDTMEGPVVKAAQEALKTNNVNLVLIWIKPADEEVIKKAFQKTIQLRKISKEVQEVVDMYFFETLVRIHRAGEGVPYTGLKENAEIEPGILAADKALETNSLDEVKKVLKEKFTKEVEEKFNLMISKKNYNKNDVQAGREFVESYVTFMHFVEELSAGEEHNEQSKIEKNEHNPHHADNKEINSETTLESHASGDHIAHILIIISTLLIIATQIVIFKMKK